MSICGVRRSRCRFVCTTAAAAVASALSPACAQDEHVLRLSLSVGPQHELMAVAGRLAANVARRSKGRLKIDIYPNSELAPQRDAIAAVQSGVVDLTFQASAVFTGLAPHIQIFDLPFLFRDAAAAYRLFDGPIGAEIFADLAAKGILGLACAHDNFRQLETTDRTIRTPGNFKGLRVRIQDSPISAGTIKALGGVPVPINISETYTALQQRVIDGLEVPLTTVLAERFSLLTKHVALTNHALLVTVFVASKKSVGILPPDLQDALTREAKTMRPYWAGIVSSRDNQARNTLRGDGVVLTAVDFPAFRKAVEPVYAQIQDALGRDYMERVDRALG